MIRWALLSAWIATAALAQEIGSEIEPPATAPAQTPPPAPATRSAPTPPPPSVAGGSGGSAGPGAFGLRAAFFGSPTSNLPTAAVGVAFFATELIKLTVDLGGAASFPAYPAFNAWGFSVAGGVELLFRTVTASVRPLVAAQVGFGKLLSDKGDDFALVLNVGGGGEYFFSQYFSMNIRALIGVPISLKSGAVGFLFFTPGVGATVYF
ncbi:MAG: hypothetical protein H6Q89_3744 [Myxococcaceae bacterium]|nr:hypothetical protein [Myxococcaceae bacterium]